MKITERRLRRIIRNVIKESIENIQDLESAVQSCRIEGLDDPSINDSDIELDIMNYILDNYPKDLDYANTSGPSIEDLPYSSSYRDELASQRVEDDYNRVIMNMSPSEYREMIAVCKR